MVAVAPGTVEEELRALLALVSSTGVGPRIVKRLVERFGSAREALGSSLGELREVDGITGSQVRTVQRLGLAPVGRLDELARRGIRLAGYGCGGYPARLTHLDDPPPVLFLRGPLALPDQACVAIVGTRRATEYGRRMARDLAAGLSEAGWIVVSGLAVGVDSAAHRAALDAGGRTVGILGCGLGRVYPARNRGLYAEMSKRGLLASEFLPGVGPNRGHFPRRNRIIAALADAVIVVQAPLRSGALITVDHALDLGRAVFGVPGPVGPPASEGVHAILRDGATPAMRAQDVIETMASWTGVGGVAPTEVRTRPPDHLAGGERGLREAVLAGLRDGIATADDLALRAGCPVGSALATLSRLEIEGSVRPLPGGRFERARR